MCESPPDIYEKNRFALVVMADVDWNDANTLGGGETVGEAAAAVARPPKAPATPKRAGVAGLQDASTVHHGKRKLQALVSTEGDDGGGEEEEEDHVQSTVDCALAS